MAGVMWPESGLTNLTDLLGGGVVISSGSSSSSSFLCPFALQPGDSGMGLGLGGGQVTKGLASSGSSKPAGSTRCNQLCTFSSEFRRVSMGLCQTNAVVVMAVLVRSAVVMVVVVVAC